MIINADCKSDVEVYGDIQEFKTSIDPKNLEYITTLLSSNLYSNPEESFIREIISNAWDSHVEAHNTDTPVIIRMSNQTITIRDYGTGLSPERFRTIFCNIGSSTKRESNDYIGGFGLGRFSALACSNTVYIDSYYEGVHYSYIMVKDGNNITTNLVLTEQTTEANGVAVTIKNISLFTKYIDGLKNCIFFPNIYIDSTSYGASDINRVKIKRYKNMACASILVRNKILLGNVLYPCDESKISNESRDFLHNIYNTGIVISLNIGDIDITPNRESIIYTDATIDLLNKRILEAREELHQLIRRHYLANYTSIISLLSDYGKRDYIPVDDILYSNGIYTSYHLPTSIPGTLTYKGKPLDNNTVSHISSFRHWYYHDIRCLLYDHHVYTRSIPYKYQKYTELSSTRCTKVLIPYDIRLTSDIKDFLADRLGNVLIIGDNNVDKFYDDEVSGYNYRNSSGKEYFVDYLKELQEDFVKFDVNDPNFLEFKEEQKQARKNSTGNDLTSTIVYLYGVNSDLTTYRRDYYNIKRLIDELTRKHQGVIITHRNDPNLEFLYKISHIRDYSIYVASKALIEQLHTMNLSFLVDIEKLVTRDPILSIMKSYKTLYAEYYRCTQSISINDFIETLPPEFAKNILEVTKKIADYSSILDYTPVTNCPYMDSFTYSTLNKFIKYAKAYKEAHSMVSYNNVFLSYVVMKQKGYRISYDFYKRIKENKFIRLCQKS